MRVLHLVDPQSPDGGPCTLQLLGDLARRLQPATHDVVIIGTRHCVKRARRCGVTPAGAICPPRALPWAGRSALRSFLSAKAQSGNRYDLIHAWTARTAALAAALTKTIPSLATLHVGPKPGFSTSFEMRVLSAPKKQPLQAASMAVWREYRERGLPKNRLTLLPPAVDPASRSMIDRAAVRQRWASILEQPIDEKTFVIGLLGEPVNWTNVRAAALVACRVALSGRSVKVVVAPDSGSPRARLEAMGDAARLTVENVIVVDEKLVEPWQVVNGLDAALMLGSGTRERPASSVLPLLWAYAAGVPVVAESSDAWCDMIEDGVSGWLVNPGDINAAAERITRLIDDRSLAARIGENGKQLAGDTFNIDAYCVRIQHAYDLLLANRAVHTLEGSREHLSMFTEAALV